MDSTENLLDVQAEWVRVGAPGAPPPGSGPPAVTTAALPPHSHATRSQGVGPLVSPISTPTPARFRAAAAARTAARPGGGFSASALPHARPPGGAAGPLRSTAAAAWPPGGGDGLATGLTTPDASVGDGGATAGGGAAGR
jgi:hypothetical protein